MPFASLDKKLKNYVLAYCHFYDEFVSGWICGNN